MVKKLIYLGLLSFNISLSTNIIRTIKNTNIAILISPEIISFIKCYFEMPFAIFIIILYNKLRQLFKLVDLFSYIIGSFALIFSFLAFFTLYSTNNSSSLNFYLNNFPRFTSFILIIFNWNLVLFYILGELYPIILYSIFFWQLANSIVKLDEAKFIYPKIIFSGQISLVFLTFFIEFFNNYLQRLYLAELKQNMMIKIFISINFIISLLAIFLYRKVYGIFNNNNIINNITKLSFSNILKSQDLFFIFLQIVFYAASSVTLEILLMSKLKILCSDYSSFLLLYCKILLYTNLSSIFLSVISSKIIKGFSTHKLIYLTPVLTLFFGSLFVLSSIISNDPKFIIIIGAMQYICIKSTKYVFFDYSKEVLYLSIDKETRTDGKFSTELLGMKVGKIIGGGFQVIILTILPNVKYSDVSIFLLLFLLIISLIWIYIIRQNQALRREF